MYIYDYCVHKSFGKIMWSSFVSDVGCTHAQTAEKIGGRGYISILATANNKRGQHRRERER